MKSSILSIVLLLSLGFTISIGDDQISKDDSVAETLFSLGKEKPSHYLDKIDPVEVQKGHDLIHLGRTTHNGKRSKFISKYYKCTSCHNTQREDKDLKVVNPKSRLDYAKEKDIPYLQGSTFWGIVNRDTWYNDDYFLKYGELAEKAKNSLEESTQLCAKVCSQGRELNEWEMNAILSYYWSLEMKMEDLGISLSELNALSNSNEKKQLIETSFLAKSPASFSEPPKDKKLGYGMAGDSDNGKSIYELSCQHCHGEGGESDVVLDNGRTTFKWLKRNISKNSQLSIYEIIRKGTYSELGHKEYMPHYTLEKMSDQQIEDLRAYIEKMAN